VVRKRLAALLSPWEVDRLGAGWEAQLQSDALTGCRLNPLTSSGLCSQLRRV